MENEIISPKSLGLVYSGVGDFGYDSKNLNSLEGSPTEVNGNFCCANNNLTFLGFCPKYITKGFYCQNNNLTSLKYAPYIVGLMFRCDRNAIDFIDMPKIKAGKFYFGTDPSSETAGTCKNIHKILCRLETCNDVNMQYHGHMSQLLTHLIKRKNKGEDLELLLEEGANWCAMNGYPSEFWGDY